MRMDSKKRDEIEITEEMREVGAKVLAAAYDSVGDGVDGLRAERTFRAMLQVSASKLVPHGR